MAGETLTIRHLRAVEGWLWLKAGFRLFRASPFTWILLVLACGLLLLALARLPGPGQLMAPFVWPTLAAGFMAGCQAQAAGEKLRLAHLFIGFRHPAARRLMLLGALYLTASTGLLMFLLGQGIDLGALVDNAMRLQSGTDKAALAVANRALERGFVAELGLFLPLFMTVWFAPALILLDGQTVGRALQLSFLSCFHNTVPFLVFAAVLLALSLIAVYPFGIGLIVLTPVTLASSYASYCSVFERRRSDA